MYPRTEYEMTEADLAELMAAMKPTPVMMIGGYSPPSPQENANAAWARLGLKMGFDAMTVQPISGKGNRFFSAVPSETPEARETRLALEKVESDLREVERLNSEIDKLERQRAAILNPHKPPA